MAFLEYREQRKFQYRPSYATGILMLCISLVNLITGWRISTDEDTHLVWQTMVIMCLALVILKISDENDKRRPGRDEEASFDHYENSIGKAYEAYGIYASFGSWLLVMSSGLSLVLHKDVPVTRGDELPPQYGVVWLIGAVCFLFSVSWLLVSVMLRPVFATWAHRAAMIEQIRNARNDQDAWDALNTALHTMDETLQELWDITHSGFVWMAGIFACLMGVVLSVLSLLDSFTHHGGLNLEDDGIQVMYFISGSSIAALSGLTLASTAFVQPFWTDQCILKAAMFAQGVDDERVRIERMRFCSCAKQVSLCAKLLTVPFTGKVVQSLYVHIGVVVPTVLSFLRAYALNHSVTSYNHTSLSNATFEQACRAAFEQ